MSLHTDPSRSTGFLRHAMPALHALWQRLLDRDELRRQRRRLTRLDDHILRDIGLTRDEAEVESRRGAWDAPPHWRHR